jgi:molecular chaperone HtpG
METHAFEAETQKLLGLMIHSLYSNKEIFLRELISNASDALDRRRFEALSNSDLASEEPGRIQLSADAGERVLTLEDNGVGMNREEVVEHLGTIARSGTLDFIEKLGDDSAVTPELIGQFGVGFYASFMVADEVEVVTRRAGEDKATRWVSQGDGSYSIGDGERETAGTTIRLKLAAVDSDAGVDDFCDEWVLRRIVTRYSDFVAYPVHLTLLAVADEAGTPAERREIEEPLNSMKAIWTRPEADVSEQEYGEFYRHIAHDPGEPLLRVRTTIEGTFEARALLYVPSQAPFDLYHRERAARGVQLYVRRVFIMDECRELLPEWLRFVRGVVDAEDLPLNVSREMLQQDRQIRVIRKHLVKKLTEALAELAQRDTDAYRSLWSQFGPVLKEGLLDLEEKKERILPLLLTASTHDDEALTSLQDYLARIPEGQDSIYYAVGPKLEVLRHSPHLEAFADKGIEVLFFSDPVDEVWLTQGGVGSIEFEGRTFRSVGRGEVELDDVDATEEQEAREQRSQDREKQAEGYDGVLKAIRAALQEDVREVRLSSRLTRSPACLVLEEGDLSPQLEAMLKQAGQEVPQNKPILELNPDHAILEKLSARFEANPTDGRIAEAARALYGQAVLAEGGQLDDPAGFGELVTTLLSEVL